MKKKKETEKKIAATKPEAGANPFLEFILKNPRYLNVHPANAEELIDKIENRTFEILSSPEEFINCDVSHFPDGGTVNFIFPKGKLDDYFFYCCVSKENGNLEFDLMIDTDENKERAALNPYYLLTVMEQRSKKTLLKDNSSIDTDSGYSYIIFYRTVPAKGNMLIHYKEAVVALEKLYNESKQQLIKEANATSAKAAKKK